MIGEVRDIVEGVEENDFEKVLINCGLLLFHLGPNAYHVGQAADHTGFITLSTFSAEVAEFFGLGSVNEAFKHVFLHHSHKECAIHTGNLTVDDEIKEIGQKEETAG